ncbi:putative nucleic acid-binding protein [Hamiltosporidium tvaerminnensis]|uniref:Putative nucleic acid-binding protein n=2 Tax=Hamiltosporidium TaxID=1176354 RepID=A0A4Q9KX66_9MICR|nr:putative nucleic acid-binding protein [Hamiltosporidium tvaerminnensis]TBU06413.1 putative nucleic acid-binding protein [Hamiltosporidium magnivora]TBU11652.1 putative nucleic acid-binding protein [Hamiltosporidium tvaerminnensis]
MIGIIDTSSLIKRNIKIMNYTKFYTTTSVINEIKDNETLAFYNLNSYKIEIMNPSTIYIERIEKINIEKQFKLSNTDVEVVALTLQLYEDNMQGWISIENVNTLESVVCLTEDKSMISALCACGVISDGFNVQRNYKIRCFTCYKIYDNDIDFCKKCGYNTLSRISFTETNEGIKFHFKKNFNYCVKDIKDKYGKPIKSADQRNYEIYKREQRKKEKENKKILSAQYF